MNKVKFLTYSYLCLLSCFLLLIKNGYSQKYALLIGVDYPYPLTLDWTGQDAIKFGEILKENFGFQVKTLTSKEQTNKIRLIQEFESIKKNNYQQLIVFFQGMENRTLIARK